MDSLPEEILVAVMDKLDRKADMSTILSLRGVSRKWRRVATPYVHIAVQNYQPRDGGHADDAPWNWNWNFHPSTDLLCYLCWKLSQKPHLARFVKEVASRPWKDARWKSEVAKADLGARYRGALAGVVGAAAAAVPDDVKDSIVAEMLCDAGDALLAFVLILCTDIEVLMIPALDRGCGPRTRQVLRCAHAAQLQSPPLPPPRGDGREAIMLGAVRHVQLGDYVNGLCLADALDILALPKLQHLELGNLGDTTVDGSQPLPPPLRPRAPHHLQNRGPVDITLESCRLSGKGLTTLLAACGRPRSLFVKMRTGNVQPSRAPCFAEALEKYGQGLEFLYLDTTAFEDGLAGATTTTTDPHPNSNSETPTTTPSAHFLRALSTLTPTLRFLALSRADFPTPAALGAALPASLRELLVLEVNDSSDSDDGAYRNLVRGRDTPRLERVVLCQRATSNSDAGAMYDGCLRDRKLPSTRVLEKSCCTVFTWCVGVDVGE
ncbi:hypothetical protein F5Y00DRAFT_262669 [Daldinia vernicosa]|uniref:uncharacterized protein n=1 Tax=Daldinia vernicosa TaxID=114800 RepID=UPI0020074A9B|nr:uncharacterized protein F5Y00DRAFT_262669 [Daldinia vernicosa]KAI0848283.1 hypothetical protein F5Y00DRAFT_262669 [Daldinia vernicosa]